MTATTAPSRARTSPFPRLAVLLLVLSPAAPATAQFPCPEPRWRAVNSAAPGPSSIVNAMAVLPGGELLVGGWFGWVGGIEARGIALWNGASWSPLGAGVGGGPQSRVMAIIRLPDGRIAVGGEFSTAGGVLASNVAIWDGAAWSPLAAGTSGPVHALAVLPNGNLAVGGEFASAGGVDVNSIALWDGAQWSPLGRGMSGLLKQGNMPVAALTVSPGGDLIAGGSFVSAGGVTANGIARWNGAAWTAYGTGMDAPVSALAVLPGGDLVAGGEFQVAGGERANHIARWDGAAWNAMGDGVGASGLSSVAALAQLPDGSLAAGCLAWFSASSVARWDGTAWSSLGVAMHPPGLLGGGVMALALLPGGDLVAGGQFSGIEGAHTSHLARYTCEPFACPGRPFGITIEGWWGNTCPPGLLGVLHSPSEIEIVTGWCPLPELCSDMQTYYQLVAPLPGLPAGTYDVYKSVRGCGTVLSRVLIDRVTVGEPSCPCYANCDGSLIPPLLDINDFVCYLNRFAAGDPFANCDGSTIPPVLTVNDFGCFQQKFAAGCP